MGLAMSLYDLSVLECHCGVEVNLERLNVSYDVLMILGHIIAPLNYF